MNDADTQLSLLQAAPSEASPVPGRDTCNWCGAPLPAGARADSRFCNKACRQSAFRLRKRHEASRSTGETEASPGDGEPGKIQPGRFVYADPPYIGLAARYYKDQPTYAGEVDHEELICVLERRRMAGEIVGWGLSASARSLQVLFQMMTAHGVEPRLHPWVKLGGAPPATFGPHNVWEALIVVGGRKLQPGVPDALRAHPARGGGDLPGRKPLAFCAFLFDMLGMVPGDDLEDMFPGTGIVGTAWKELSAKPSPAAGGKRHVFAQQLDFAVAGAGPEDES